MTELHVLVYERINFSQVYDFEFNIYEISVSIINS